MLNFVNKRIFGINQSKKLKPQITHNINNFKGVRDITLFSSQISSKMFYCNRF